jgi:HK97 family phage portal protein
MIGALKRFFGLTGKRSGSIENPSTPLSDPDEWLYDALGAKPSSSGVRVTRESALTYSPVWRGVSLISRDVAKLPLYIYRRSADGEGKELASEHPAYMLLRHKPNRELKAFDFRQTLQAHAILEGNGLAYISRRGDGSPEELIPLLPGNSSPVRMGGQLWYVTKVGSEWHKLYSDDVLHIRGLGFDGTSGYPLWRKAKDSLGAGIAAEEFGARYFRNGASPSVVMEHPGRLDPKAYKRIRDSWNEMHTGLANMHKLAILEEGMKLNAFSSDANKAQLIQYKAFSIRDVANWLGVPPHKLGDTTKTSYASLEQENQSYLDDALDPWLCQWEGESWDKLLTERQKREDSHVIEFLRQALVRTDLATRATYYRQALGGMPWMMIDEVRGMENLNPLPDGLGKKYYVPLNVVQGDPGGGDGWGGEGNKPPKKPLDPKDEPDAGDGGGDDEDDDKDPNLVPA